MQPMATFNPDVPCMVHDELNDQRPQFTYDRADETIDPGSRASAKRPHQGSGVRRSVCRFNLGAKFCLNSYEPLGSTVRHNSDHDFS